MFRLLETQVYRILLPLSVILILTGCTQQQEKPIWENIKIGDLAPLGGLAAVPTFKTINFDIHIIDIPATNIDVLEKIWPMLQDRQIRFNDSATFSANSFIARFGQLPVWNDIRELLIAANGKKLKTASLLISADQDEVLPIAKLYDRQTTFYVSVKGTMEGVDIGQGQLALRVKAESIPDKRGVCEVRVEPVYLSPAAMFISKTKKSRKKNELVFDAAAFKLQMSDGDFVLLGPEKYEQHRITLSSLLFSRDKPKEIIRVYLIVCTKINE